MIPFLVKLANLLDKRGQYSMAREVDDLIVKLAQSAYTPQSVEVPEDLYTGPNTPPPTPVQVSPDTVAQNWVAAHSALQGLLSKLKGSWQVTANPDYAKNIDAYLASIKVLLTRVSKNQMNPKVIDWSFQAWKQFKVTVLNKIYGSKIPQEYQDLDVKINQDPKVIVKGMTPANGGIASKAPASSGGGYNIIKLIQKRLNLPTTGKWDTTTNKDFIKFMNDYLPQSMSNNVFVGAAKGQNTLKDAWDLMQKVDVAKDRSSEMYGNQLGQESPEQMGPDGFWAGKTKPTAPTKPQVQWKSKYFQITPAAKQSLQEIEKNWPGTSQQEINKLDGQKGSAGVGRNMDQETFEEMLAGRAAVDKE